MTVGELKKQLASVPDDLIVVNEAGDEGYMPAGAAWTATAWEIDLGGMKSYNTLHYKPKRLEHKEVRVCVID
jgi:hypothetical protein